MPGQPSTSSLVWRNGFIYGAIIAVIGVATALLNWQMGAYDATVQAAAGTSPSISGASTLIGCGVDLVYLAILFVAGMMTARKTGSVGAASLTGLVAGLVGAVVGSGIGLILVMTVIAPQIQLPADSPLTQSQMQAILIGGAVLGIVFALVLEGGFGAGVAALGGLVGRNTYQQANPPQVYQGSFYPGAAAGAYPNPQYPAPPPYAAPPAPPEQYSPTPQQYPPATPEQYSPMPSQQPPATPPQYPPQNPPQG